MLNDLLLLFNGANPTTSRSLLGLRSLTPFIWITTISACAVGGSINPIACNPQIREFLAVRGFLDGERLLMRMLVSRLAQHVPLHPENCVVIETTSAWTGPTGNEAVHVHWKLVGNRWMVRCAILPVGIGHVELQYPCALALALFTVSKAMTRGQVQLILCVILRRPVDDERSTLRCSRFLWSAYRQSSNTPIDIGAGILLARV